MNKYYTQEGKEVKFGDKLINKRSKETRYGVVSTTEIITLTEQSLQHLLDRGIIKEECTEEDCCMELVKKVTNKLSAVEYDHNYVGFLGKLAVLNKSAFRTLIYKLIAVELDKKYENHITDADSLYFISINSGKVLNVKDRKGINYKNIALFRCKEDANLAIECTEVMLKAVESLNAKQEN